MSLRARLKELEAVGRSRALKNATILERVNAGFPHTQRLILREMFSAWKETPEAELDALYESAFPNLEDLPGAAKAQAWYFLLEDLPLSALWPVSPQGAREYFNADLARWEEIAARPDLTPAQVTVSRWEVATLHYWVAWAQAL